MIRFLKQVSYYVSVSPKDYINMEYTLLKYCFEVSMAKNDKLKGIN